MNAGLAKKVQVALAQQTIARLLMARSIALSEGRLGAVALVNAEIARRKISVDALAV